MSPINALATVGLGCHFYTDIETIQIEHPMFKRIWDGTLDELKVAIKDDSGKILDNHDLPISLMLEYGCIATKTMIIYSPEACADVNNLATELQESAKMVYVDVQDNLDVLRAGSTMNGSLNIAGNLVGGLPKNDPPLYRGDKAAS